MRNDMVFSIPIYPFVLFFIIGSIPISLMGFFSHNYQEIRRNESIVEEMYKLW